MTDYDELDIYNGDTENDMWVDFDNYKNTATTAVFDEHDYDNFIENLNDWD